jgi:hypothetical protein
MPVTFEYRWGDANSPVRTLVERPKSITLRGRDPGDPVASVLNPQAAALLSHATPVIRLPTHGAVLLEFADIPPAPAAPLAVGLDPWVVLLRQEPALRGVEPGLRTSPEGAAVLPLEEVYVEFARSASPADRDAVLKDPRVSRFRGVHESVPDAFELQMVPGTGLDTFAFADEVLNRPGVAVACYPQFAMPSAAHAQWPLQWHLGRAVVNGEIQDGGANVVAAWSYARGSRRDRRGRVRVAVIDGGIDVEHREFRGRVFDQVDVTGWDPVPDARPRDWSREGHGTMCAGTAVARGSAGASGAAPSAALIPIRALEVNGQITFPVARRAFYWAVDHGADVICCCWGGEDGAPRFDLPPDLERAIRFAAREGRDGKGCVIVFAGGNGGPNENMDDDGYVRHEDVIAVGACAPKGIVSRCTERGAPLWCLAPVASSAGPHFYTTDLSAPYGQNPEGDYAPVMHPNTSVACAVVAGIAALMVAANPDITAADVKLRIAETCDKVKHDVAGYDPQTGKSDTYGYGRVNAFEAVLAARGIRPFLHQERPA